MVPSACHAPLPRRVTILLPALFAVLYLFLTYHVGKMVEPVATPDADGLFPAEHLVQWPELRGARVLPKDSLGTVIVFLDPKEAHPRYAIDRQEGSLAEICGEIQARVQRSRLLPDHWQGQPVSGAEYVGPALRLSVDREVRCSALYPFFIQAGFVGVRTLLVKSVPLPGASARAPAVGLIWPQPNFVGRGVVCPIIVDLDAQGHIFLNGNPKGLAANRALPELTEALDELEKSQPGAKPEERDLIIVRADHETRAGEYFQVVALVRSLGFPVSSGIGNDFVLPQE